MFCFFYSYECSAKNLVGIAKRTIQLVLTTEARGFPRQPLPTTAPIPPPYHHHPGPSQQHLVSAMYGSTVFLHCPESTGSTRGTTWQLPSKTIMEHQYRSMNCQSACQMLPSFHEYTVIQKGVCWIECCDCFTLLSPSLSPVQRDPSLCSVMGL